MSLFALHRCFFEAPVLFPSISQSNLQGSPRCSAETDSTSRTDPTSTVFQFFPFDLPLLWACWFLNLCFCSHECSLSSPFFVWVSCYTQNHTRLIVTAVCTFWLWIISGIDWQMQCSTMLVTGEDPRGRKCGIEKGPRHPNQILTPFAVLLLKTNPGFSRWEETGLWILHLTRDLPTKNSSTKDPHPDSFRCFRVWWGQVQVLDILSSLCSLNRKPPQRRDTWPENLSSGLRCPLVKQGPPFSPNPFDIFLLAGAFCVVRLFAFLLADFRTILFSDVSVYLFIYFFVFVFLFVCLFVCL